MSIILENKEELLSNIPLFLNYTYPLEVKELEESKTSKQLGYFWQIMNHLAVWYRQEGYQYYTPELCCHDLYDEAGLYEHQTTITGKELHYPARTLSKMTKKQTKEFIDFTLNWIKENTTCKLTPELWSVWLRHVTDKDIQYANTTKLIERCPEYLSYLRKEVCLQCGGGKCQAHHIRLSGYAGTGIKPPDWLAVSLCSNCHRLIHNGEQRLKIPYDYELKTYCKLSFIRYLEHK